MQKRRRREGALRRRRSDAEKWAALLSTGNLSKAEKATIQRKLTIATREVAILETRV